MFNNSKRIKVLELEIKILQDDYNSLVRKNHEMFRNVSLILDYFDLEIIQENQVKIEPRKNKK